MTSKSSKIHTKKGPGVDIDFDPDTPISATMIKNQEIMGGEDDIPEVDDGAAHAWDSIEGSSNISVSDIHYLKKKHNTKRIKFILKSRILPSVSFR